MMRRHLLSTVAPPAAFARLQLRHGSSRNKIVSAEDAVRLVRSNDVVCVHGFVAQSPPEEVLAALGAKFAETKDPSGLTVMFYGGPGDWDKRGLNHLAQPGMLKRTIGSHYGQTPSLGAMALAGDIEAYNLPMGSISRMIRAAASGVPGHLTKVGLGTMADPRKGGGKINDRTTEDIVKVVSFDGEEHLFYKAVPINVSIIRGTTADSDGNITVERESLYLDALNQAMAARSSGGVVICQVERIAADGSLNPRHVRIPGTLVDSIVVAKPENHPMSFVSAYNPGYSSEVRMPPVSKPMPLDIRKVIARRAALSLLPNQVVNLGIGMPEGVAAVADEERVLKYVNLTTEPGTHGGVGASGKEFGPAVNYDALIELHQQFDFYNGGCLDTCFLGNAQTTQAGDVNVTRVGKTLTGPGGFIDITQSTKRVNFLGPFTAGGLKVEAKDGKLTILQEGKIRKFVKEVPEVTFSGDRAKAQQQIVNYITERCVFTLTKGGLELVEVAPGVDVERDILAHMDFAPIIRHAPRLMSAKIFTDAPMGIRESLFGSEMAHRLHYDDASNTLFVDLSTLHVSTAAEAAKVLGAVRAEFETVIRQRCHVEANYDDFEVAGALRREFDDGVDVLEKAWYLSVRRHTGRTFSHSKSSVPRKRVDARMSHDAAWRYVRQHNVAVDAESFHNMFRRKLDHADGADGMLSPGDFAALLQKLSARA
jgi:propionate CoA-transferase